MRTLAGLLLIVSTFPNYSVCQSDSPPQRHTERNLSAFAQFFNDVAALRHPTSPILLNGQLSHFRSTSLQEALGVSDREADILSAIAVKLQEDLREFGRTARAGTFSARLDSISGDSDSKKQLLVLQLKRNGIISSAIETLKRDLGPNRFDTIDRFVLEGVAAGSYFPLRAN